MKRRKTKMKNKLNIKAKMLSAAVVTAAFFVGITPMTAYAGGVECSCEAKCTDDHVNEDCPLCKEDPSLCCGEEPATDDPEAVKPKEEEHYGPLTPDGNMELVDDYGSIEAGGKQFITVVTKAGNYFYIIIDRDDDGNENVHFLNMVDEADLLSLMDDEEVEKYIAATQKEEEVAPTPTVEPTPEPEPEEPEPEKPEKKGHGGLIALLLLATVGGIGGYIWFTKYKKSKPVTSTEDPDADYDENEDDYFDGLLDDLDDDPDMADAKTQENTDKEEN